MHRIFATDSDPCAECSPCQAAGQAAAFYFLDTDLDPDTYVVVCIVDGLSDRIYVGTTTDPALATKWVDRGWQGSGAKHLSHDFSQVSFEGDCTVTAS
jgi:hypothetical protein